MTFRFQGHDSDSTLSVVSVVMLLGSWDWSSTDWYVYCVPHSKGQAR